MQRIARYAGIALISGVQVFQFAYAENLRFIIKFKQSPKSLLSIKQKAEALVNLPVQQTIPMANGAYVILFDNKNSLAAGLTPAESKEQTLQKLKSNPGILYALEDRIGYFKPVPRPAIDNNAKPLSHDSQWDEFAAPAGVKLESAVGKRDGAWAYTTGKSTRPVVIAVLDTGIEENESLTNNVLRGDNGKYWGWNFSANNANLADETGSYHGTHVSGTIAGYGQVIIGMGEDLKILPIKIPDKSGMFYESSVINGIVWAVGGAIPGIPHNPYTAQVLNISFAVDLSPGKEMESCDQALQEALDFARKQGAVVAVAGGNDNRLDQYKAPAVCNNVMKIASTGPEGLRAYYSNYGSGLSFAAPGGDMHYGDIGGILSTVKPGTGYMNSGYDFFQGTSMASPHVAGIAGLVIAASSKPLTPQRLEQIIYTTTHDFGKSSNENKSCVGKKPCGHGIIDAENAVKTAKSGFDVLITSPKPEELNLTACQPGLLMSPSKVDSQGATWIQIQSSCENTQAFNSGHVRANDQGEILASYGSTIYRLEQSKFSRCEVIGYDGVGCWQ